MKEVVIFHGRVADWWQMFAIMLSDAHIQAGCPLRGILSM